MARRKTTRTSTNTGVSGRYEGLISPPDHPNTVLDLRVDIDAIANAPAMNRISGDFYQTAGSGAHATRTYVESWIVDHPVVNRTAGRVEITGKVRFWASHHPATTMTVTIGKGTGSARSAAVAFAETGGSTRNFACKYASDCFRALEMEIAVCKSANTPPVLPTYDTHWHKNRPANTPQRTLAIDSAYREAGVEVKIKSARAVVDDSAAKFKSWTAAELHDVMATHYSRFRDTWPNWQMWGFLAGEFEDPAVGGIMFDAADPEAPAFDPGAERQGFAVFRKHSWFDALSNSAPTTQDHAMARRQFLYTWVHEAGHAFNLLHSWDKARPDSLSWMNYDWKYDARNGEDTFWKKFAFRFDDDELIHVRHGNRASVIMGGDPWSSGGHMESPNLAMAQVEGKPPVELSVRSKQQFEPLEPVIVELRLRNLRNAKTAINTHLSPEFGNVVVYIRTPTGETVQYRPNVCKIAVPNMRVLGAAETRTSGDDRHSKEIFLTYGAGGFYFGQPGEYRIRAVYLGASGVALPSNVHRLRVGRPLDKATEIMAQDYFDDNVGLALYFQGAQSPRLERGRAVLEAVADRFKGTVGAANVAMALANGASKPFFRVRDDAACKVVQSARPDPERALRLTEAPLNALRQNADKTLNLAYGRVVRRRADYHCMSGDPQRARDELATLQKDLSARGVHRAALAEYRTLASELPAGPETPAMAAAARAPKKPAQAPRQARAATKRKPGRAGRKTSH